MSGKFSTFQLARNDSGKEKVPLYGKGVRIFLTLVKSSRNLIPTLWAEPSNGNLILYPVKIEWKLNVTLWGRNGNFISHLVGIRRKVNLSFVGSEWEYFPPSGN